MKFSRYRFIVCALLTTVLCTVICGCGDSIKKPNINYTSISIMMETAKSNVDKLGNVANAYVLIYDKNGTLQYSTPNTKGYERDKKVQYSGGYVSKDSIASTTVVFVDVNGKMLGIASRKIDPPSGKNAAETYDMGTVYSASEAKSKYAVDVNLLTESAYSVNFEATLVTADNIKQDITSQKTMTMSSVDLTKWESSNTEVLSADGTGQGNFNVKGNGMTTVTATFAGVLSGHTTYQVK